jgi:aldehyde dehydrogenase (NAD+)
VHAAGLPKGVFNLVSGDGPTVGAALSAHPDIAMMSFTGSTRAGILVAKAAADTVKRVAQELGGKSANIILADANFADAVKRGTAACFSNSGQSCDAPTRMFVPADRHAEALEIAKGVAASHRVGAPREADTVLGPVVSKVQFDKIQRLIKAGIDEGATLAAGGVGRPPGLDSGYYVKPTVFKGHNKMRIFQEEIFGPVVSVTTFKDDDEALSIANDTLYGLGAGIWSRDANRLYRFGRAIQAGRVWTNCYHAYPAHAAFGGYKQSGIGRETHKMMLDHYQQTKNVLVSYSQKALGFF